VKREELMKRVCHNVLRRIGHEPCEWAESTNPLFNSIAHCSCTKQGCSLIFGLKQHNEFYSMFAMKAGDYETTGLIEVTFKDSEDSEEDANLEGMEDRITNELNKNRSIYLQIPRETYCSCMQNFT